MEAKTKDAVIIRPPGLPGCRKKCGIHGGCGRIFFAPKFCAVNAFNAEAKPSAVFQETDSICPPTRWTAMARKTEGGNHSGQYHGDHAVDHALDSCWQTNAEDIFIKFSRKT